MNHKKTVSMRKFSLGAAFFMIILSFFVSVAFAIEKEGPKNESVVRHPPEIHGSGKIDRVDKDQIVVDDKMFLLSSGYEKRTADDEALSQEKLSAGMKIAFRLDAKRQIVTIWILKE
ncbi:hypothetical protein [Desulforegula conservatrix]|uniref:hypothetical protein n=1 Tax=Desulforegula conservatrix TaxID=153026 RepID=UPI00040A67C2|nr:hypothetical protein [Desulforegula conservatrix]